MAEIRKTLQSGVSATSTRRTRPSARMTGGPGVGDIGNRYLTARSFSSGAFDGDAPEKVEAYLSSLAESGLDQHVGALRFPGDRIGTFECSLRHPTPSGATICGSKGVLKVLFPFWCPTSYSVQTMTGLGSQDWSEPQTYTLICLSAEGPFNFVNS